MNNAKIKINWPLIGNEHISEYLTRNLVKKEVSGVYIFSGPSNLGKTTAAKYFAQLLLCDNNKSELGEPCDKCPSCRIFKDHESTPNELSGLHGDFHYLKKNEDKKNISIEQVRELITQLGMASFLNSYKIAIIKDAEKLTIGAANALLKTLEEPKQKVVIILTTSALDMLPPTIISRSMILRFLPVSSGIIYDHLLDKYKIGRSAAKEFSRTCLGRPALAVKFMEDKNFYKAYTDIAGSFMLALFKDLNERFLIVENLLAKKAGQDLVKEAEKILVIWQGMIRDLILAHFENFDLLQNEFISKEIQKINRNFTLEKLLNLNISLERSKEYIGANVNPKLAMECLMLEI